MHTGANLQLLSEKVIEILTTGESPLEKWLDIEKNNLAELYTFHIIYGWFFIQEQELIEMSEENIKQYFVRAFLRIKRLEPSLEISNFFPLYSDRFQKFGEELSMVRNNHLSFPNYFYSRVCQYPLQNNNFSTKYRHPIWSEIELIDMFAHQINHLQNSLNKLL